MARRFAASPRLAAGAALAALVSAAPPALSADLLRGGFYEERQAVAPVTWEGAYIGGFGGAGDARVNFARSFNGSVERLLHQTALLSETDVENLLVARGDTDLRAIFGGFGGYNFQADEVVFGFEIDYTRGGLKGETSDAQSRFYNTSNGYRNEIDLFGQASARLQDWVTFRGRAGYVAGRFMPYLTAGIAIGRYDVRTRVDSALTQTDADPVSPPALPAIPTIFDTVSDRKERWEPGFVAGAGVDISLASNIFLRGEYQYITFQRAGGARFDVNMIKGGAGILF